MPVWAMATIPGGVVVQAWPPATSWPSVRQASAGGTVKSAIFVPVVAGDGVRKIELPEA